MSAEVKVIFSFHLAPSEIGNYWLLKIFFKWNGQAIVAETIGIGIHVYLRQVLQAFH